MRTFLYIWLGQIVSLLGSKITEYAFSVWVYQQTKSLTQFSLTLVFMVLPNVIILPLAGALVDRWDRRLVIMLGNSVAAITALVMGVLVYLDLLHIWHIYIAVAILSVCDAFQVPAYTAAITQLVPKKNQTRANGMTQVSKGIAKIIAPAVAGILIKFIELKGILILDFISYLVAISTLFMVRFPKLQLRKTQKLKTNRLWYEIVSAFHYINRRSGLLWLLAFVGTINFTTGVLEVVFLPFLLNLGSSDESGRVLSIGGFGVLLGSLIISIWGGPKRRIYGILIFVPLQGVFILLGGLNASILFSAVAIFGFLFAQPIVVSCNQAIWQSKVPMEMQGRVFALQQMLEKSLAIVAYLITGPLIDYMLEPLMANQGLIAHSLNKFIRAETGQGIALLMILVGTINIMAAIVAYREPRLRYVEKELPDAIESKSHLHSSHDLRKLVPD